MTKFIFPDLSNFNPRTPVLEIVSYSLGVGIVEGGDIEVMAREMWFDAWYLWVEAL